MPNSRSRSPASRGDQQQRSRSPRQRRDEHRPKRSGGGGGFRWKEKRRDDDGRGGEDDRRLERGYRDRDRDRGRDRERERARSTSRDMVRKEKPDAEPKTAEQPRKEKKEKKEKKENKSAAVPTGESMIIVNVNDRLGTKASIPCLASDPIRLFKAQVAAAIGRQPHEIMLKRQGERPFKDQLTLEDYGVSNGVQLDLEVDTGD